MRELRAALGYSATWLPDVPVRLGDVVELTDYTYRRVRSATELGVPIRVRKGKGRSVIDYKTSDKVTVKVAASVDGLAMPIDVATARAALEVEFGAEDAVLFQAGPAMIEEVENLEEVGDAVMARLQRNEWERAWVLVTEVVKTSRTVALVSAGKGGKVTFSARSGGAFGPTSLIDPDAQLALESSTGMATLITSDQGLTPLFRGHGFVKKLLHKGRFAPIRSNVEGFAEVDYADFA
jgi:acyl-CoA hydrolase